VTGIADVPLIACQSGSMVDCAESNTLENCHFCPSDGVTNPAYHISPSDSEKLTSRDNGGEENSKRGSRRLGRSSRVSSARKPVESLQAGAENQVTHSHSGIRASASGASNDMNLVSAGSGDGSQHRQSSEDMADESSCESNDSASHWQTSQPIGATLVVTTPALNQQNSVRVPPPLPHSCTSVAANAIPASSYSDSELIPKRNSISHDNVARMVATEHLVMKQQPEVPQVFLSLYSRETVSKLTPEQRMHNRTAIRKELRQWHLQRSLSADATSPSRSHLCNDASARVTGRSRLRGRACARLLSHPVSSPNHPPVHGSADVAGVTGATLLFSLSTPCSSGLSSLGHDLPADDSSGVTITDSADAPDNSSTQATENKGSAAEEETLEDQQTDDAVFDEATAGDNAESSSAVAVDVSQTQSSELTASVSDDSSEHHAGVPNRAILRRGSG